MWHVDIGRTVTTCRQSQDPVCRVLKTTEYKAFDGTPRYAITYPDNASSQFIGEVLADVSGVHYVDTAWMAWVDADLSTFPDLEMLALSNRRSRDVRRHLPDIFKLPKLTMLKLGCTAGEFDPCGPLPESVRHLSLVGVPSHPCTSQFRLNWPQIAAQLDSLCLSQHNYKPLFGPAWRKIAEAARFRCLTVLGGSFGSGDELDVLTESPPCQSVELLVWDPAYVSYFRGSQGRRREVFALLGKVFPNLKCLVIGDTSNKYDLDFREITMYFRDLTDLWKYDHRFGVDVSHQATPQGAVVHTIGRLSEHSQDEDRKAVKSLLESMSAYVDVNAVRLWHGSFGDCDLGDIYMHVAGKKCLL